VHRSRTPGRRVWAILVIALSLWAVLYNGNYASRDVEALKLPVQTLDELSISSDIVFVGTVTGRAADGGGESRYAFRVDIPLKGGLMRKTELTAIVPQNAGGGLPGKGETYLVLLRKTADGGHVIAGGDHGYIRLKNGRAESPYYSQEEVDRYLARFSLKVKTIYERLVPQDKPAERSRSTREATEPAMLWTGGIALAALLVGLFARAIRQRRYRT